MHSCYAFSYDAAVKHLDGSKVFQVVILDLRLPETQGLPEVDDQDLGLALLEKCIERDRYPIPRSCLSADMLAQLIRSHSGYAARQFLLRKASTEGDYAFLENKYAVPAGDAPICGSRPSSS